MRKGLNDKIGVVSVKAITSLPDAQNALCLLNKVVKHITPLLHRRNWKIGCLKEFYPAKVSAEEYDQKEYLINLCLNLSY